MITTLLGEQEGQGRGRAQAAGGRVNTRPGSSCTCVCRLGGEEVSQGAHISKDRLGQPILKPKSHAYSSVCHLRVPVSVLQAAT